MSDQVGMPISWESVKQSLKERIAAGPNMDASLYKTIGLSPQGIMGVLLVDLPAFLESVPEGCSVMKSVDPSLPMKIALVFMQSRTQLHILTALPLEGPPST